MVRTKTSKNTTKEYKKCQDLFYQRTPTKRSKPCHSFESTKHTHVVNHPRDPSKRVLTCTHPLEHGSRFNTKRYAVSTISSRALHLVVYAERTAPPKAPYQVSWFSRNGAIGRVSFQSNVRNSLKPRARHHTAMMGSIKAGRKVRATVLLTLGASSIYVVDAHPLCWYGPDRAVSMTAEATFCPNSEPEGFCCEPFEEQSLQETYEDTRVSAECQDLYKEVNGYSAL